MYTLMSFKTALLTECLITHITSIRSLTTMYALMSYKTALLIECLITYFTAIRALTTMNVLMSYKTALLTECPITHITQIWTLTPLYLTRISAFITVYMKLFIQSTLVKTQTSNIRIYSDRNDKYFYSNVCIN